MNREDFNKGTEDNYTHIMKHLTQSYKYIIELTEAYQNNFIIQNEYKTMMTNEIIFISLRLFKLKDSEFILYSSMFYATIIEAKNILNTPKPLNNIKFNPGCVNVKEFGREIIKTNGGKLFSPSHQNLITLPKNIKL